MQKLMPMLSSIRTVLQRLNLFFALSRTPHGLLDLATPAFAALLWLKEFPPVSVIALGLLTAFAGYTAVYALNDLLGCDEDRKKLKWGGLKASGSYLDAVLIRHPIATGTLSFTAGLLWAVFWAAIALWGAHHLNPVCMYIFIGAAAGETVYCCLSNVSPLRTLISGVVKTAGPIAAVYAVDPVPDTGFVLCLFLMLFFWEIGGQNIPADWTDIQEDRWLQARTVPLALGTAQAGVLIVALLTSAVALSAVLFMLAATAESLVVSSLSIVTGISLLLAPALRLKDTQNRLHALELFNRASYYPLALLCITLFMLLF